MHVKTCGMPSVVVTLCHPSMTNQRSLPGKYWMCVMRSQTHLQDSANDLQALERFVVLMHDRSSNVTTINEDRLNLFARKQRQYDLIPQTQAALKEHAKRASYEAGYMWGQALKRHPQMPSPSYWGWVEQDEE